MKKPTLLPEGAKRLMGALVRMKPKPHEEMKAGKQATTKAAKKRGRPSRKHAK
jgi:hypothetical protein